MNDVVEAKIESPTGTRVAIVQSPRYPARKVIIDRAERILEYQPAVGLVWILDDFLADIIVRGIRSLEEERAMRLSKASLYASTGATVEEIVDDGEPAVDALYRLMPGLSDSGEELQRDLESLYENED